MDGGVSNFTDIGAGVQTAQFPALAWGDYDNDGDLDLVVSGFDGLAERTRIYRNDGNDTFTDIGAGLTNVYYGALAWGDYDNDGDLDLLVSGLTASSIATVLYVNNGGTFSDSGVSLPAVHASAAAWGDYDNDLISTSCWPETVATQAPPR